MSLQALSTRHYDSPYDLISSFFSILGTWRGKVPVAIKQLRDDRVDAMPGGYEQARNEFFKEMKVFQMVNHPNLVQVRRIIS